MQCFEKDFGISFIPSFDDSCPYYSESRSNIFAVFVKDGINDGNNVKVYDVFIPEYHPLFNICIILLTMFGILSSKNYSQHKGSMGIQVTYILQNELHKLGIALPTNNAHTGNILQF